MGRYSNHAAEAGAGFFLSMGESLRGMAENSLERGQNRQKQEALNLLWEKRFKNAEVLQNRTDERADARLARADTNADARLARELEARALEQTRMRQNRKDDFNERQQMRKDESDRQYLREQKSASGKTFIDNEGTIHILNNDGSTRPLMHADGKTPLKSQTQRDYKVVEEARKNFKVLSTALGEAINRGAGDDETNGIITSMNNMLDIMRSVGATRAGQDDGQGDIDTDLIEQARIKAMNWVQDDKGWHLEDKPDAGVFNKDERGYWTVRLLNGVPAQVYYGTPAYKESQPMDDAEEGEGVVTSSIVETIAPAFASVPWKKIGNLASKFIEGARGSVPLDPFYKDNPGIIQSQIIDPVAKWWDGQDEAHAATRQP